MIKEPKKLRQRWVAGGIHEIDLLEGVYGYCQVLEDPQVAFYHLFRKEGEPQPSLDEITQAPVSFKISVYGEGPFNRWPRLGKVPLDAEINKYEDHFRYNATTQEYSIIGHGYPPNGTTVPKERIKGLECQAVWQAVNVEQRLRDLHAGRLNYIVEMFRLRPKKEPFIKDFYADQGYDFHWIDHLLNKRDCSDKS
ncbi:MAG: hypothetical protein GW769_07665 [Alphaproteobacteria bacterium]|nr:hypothetical protein [Alphaproteobacteria bacterium]